LFAFHYFARLRSFALDLIPCRNHVSRSWHHHYDIHLLCSQTTIYKKQKTKMSLASSPDFQIRPEDKAFDMLFPADDPPTNSFDEYLNENYDFGDGDNKETFDDFFDFFEKEATSRDNGCLSPITRSTKEEVSPPQPWRKGLWCLNQHRASLPRKIQDKGRGAHITNGNAWSSRAEAVDKARGKAFTNFSRPVPRSPPHTPSYQGTRKVPATSPRTARKVRNIPQRFSREGTLSPKSSYARNQRNSEMAYQELLQCHLQNIHLLTGDEAETLSPSISASLIQLEHLARGNSANVTRNDATACGQALASPIDDIKRPYPSVENGNGAFDPSHESLWHSNGLNAALPAREQDLNSAGYLPNSHDGPDVVWAAESLNAPIGSQYAYNSQTEYKYLGGLQQCWPPPTTSASQPDAPHSYKELYPAIVAPIPHRPTHQLLQDPVSPSIAGLGIQYSEIDSPIAGCVYPALSPLEPAYAYPPLPEIAPEPVHTFTDTSPFTTPQHNHHPTNLPPSRSASPSISPTNTKYNYAATSRSLRQTSPTRQSANRRKSIGAPKASSFTNSHHHSAPPSKPPRAPRTPKTPTGAGGFGVIDFVNFTPKDSVKLLSDVAPSGSSKTRARREQEARDKRRRLSEAAVRAVRRAAKAAGGDVGDGEVEALERAILA